jgi:probable HAF family extracellular repeat protein
VRGTAFAINDSGVIVGYSDDAAGIARPFRWTEIGGMVALPVPPGAGDGQARGINGSGTVVGFYHPTGSDQRAAAWPAGGGVVELPLCSGGTWSTAWAINDAGVVVGDCTQPGKRGTGGTFAARWLPDPARPNVWLAPELLANPICGLGDRAQAVNNAGEIVGYGCAGPFFWSEVHGFQALPILPRGGNGLGALGINDPSPEGTFRIVGNLNTSSGQGHAVWWPHP